AGRPDRPPSAASDRRRRVRRRLRASTLSLIRNMFLHAGQRTVAIAVWVTSYSVGGAIGPLLGGVLLQYFWWGSVFLLGVPVMLLLLVLGPVLLPEFRDPQAGRLDLFSAALSLFAVLAVIYGLKQIAEHGLKWLPALSILAGLALGIAFVIGSVVYSLGLSPVIILATDLIVGSAPVERAGAASAISETSSELGGARDRDPREHRHGRVSQLDGQCRPGRRPT